MPMTDAIAHQQINDRLSEILKLLRDIETQRNRTEHNLNNITKIHEKVTPDDKVSTYYQQKLRNAYNAAIIDAQQEEEILRKTLAKIYEIRVIRNERRIWARNTGNKETIRRGAHMKMLVNIAQTLPLYVGKTPSVKPPPLCGMIPAEPSYIAKTGDMVAALVKDPVKQNEQNWILAEVVQYNPVTNKYEVDDIDEEQKDRHTLSRNLVVPLPLMKVNPETDPDALFPKGSIVMALFPQTTCFYKAIVSQVPTTVTQEYEIMFEDGEYPSGYSPPLNVAQRYVISINTFRGASTTTGPR